MMLCTILSKQHSDPTLSVFILIACQMDFYHLGPQDTASIKFFNYIFALFESPKKSVRPVPGCFSNMTDFHGLRHLEFLIPS